MIEPVREPPALLAVDDLHVSFGAGSSRAAVVDGICLELHAGRVLVVLGESGSGKSVTTKAVLRLLGRHGDATGAIRFGGRDLLRLSDREMLDLRGAEIALVPQNPSGSLDPLRRVGAQLAEVLRRHAGLRRRTAVRARVLELFAQVGIPDPQRIVRAYPHELSGGLQQRVVIAIAVSCAPKVLLTDEPTTALDVTVQAQILDLFRRLVDQSGTAVLLVTHDVGVAAEVGDEVAVMYAGRIVERGPAAEVLAVPRHPYTAALLASVPGPASERGTLLAIGGQPPVAGRSGPGCAFAPRCALATAGCRHGVPELTPLGDGRWAACPVVAPGGHEVLAS